VAIRRKEPNAEETEWISSHFLSPIEIKQISLDDSLKEMLESNQKTKRFAFQLLRSSSFLSLYAKRINRIEFSNERPPQSGTIGIQFVHD